MTLSGIGQEVRRSVVLVLHDETQPWMTWKPSGARRRVSALGQHPFQPTLRTLAAPCREH